MSDPQAIHVKLEGEQKELSIYTGKALEKQLPKKVHIEGAINAVSEYLNTRTPKPSTDYVLFSRSKMRIEYVGDEKNPLGTTVIGLLTMNPDLEKLKINDDNTTKGPTEMSSFLKRHRSFFVDTEECMKICTALNNFNAKVNQELEKADDKRGNYKSVVEKTVTSNVPESFKLRLPIFSGDKPSVFNVEICFDVSDASVVCWLESADLFDLKNSKRDELIDREVKLISKMGLIVIEQ